VAPKYDSTSRGERTYALSIVVSSGLPRGLYVKVVLFQSG
jgi:hypothetical protein